MGEKEMYTVTFMKPLGKILAAAFPGTAFEGNRPLSRNSNRGSQAWGLGPRGCGQSWLLCGLHKHRLSHGTASGIASPCPHTSAVSSWHRSHMELATYCDGEECELCAQAQVLFIGYVTLNRCPSLSELSLLSCTMEIPLPTLRGLL